LGNVTLGGEDAANPNKHTKHIGSLALGRKDKRSAMYVGGGGGESKKRFARGRGWCGKKIKKSRKKAGGEGPWGWPIGEKMETWKKVVDPLPQKRARIKKQKRQEGGGKNSRIETKIYRVDLWAGKRSACSD